MSQLEDCITSAVNAPNPAWFPGLAAPLAQTGWTRLSAIALGQENYGTNRFLAGDAAAERHVIAAVGWPQQTAAPMLIEVLREPIRKHYASIGLRFSALDDQRRNASAKLQQAIALIAELPSLAETISALVRVVHIIYSPDADIDISHSDPAVPFSVFVSIPISDRDNSPMRLAESIVHEAMHLQLSLIEAVVPIVVETQSKSWSPWQRTPRPIQGVIHGIYVFLVIDQFIGAIAGLNCVRCAQHLTRRRREIRAELLEAAPVCQSNDLTLFGKKLLQRLYADL